MFSATPWQKYLLGLFSFMLLGIATIGFMLCMAAFVIIRVDTPEYVLISLTTVMLTFSAFIDSFILGKIFREKGIVIGITISVIFIFLITAVACYYQTFSLTNILFTKYSAVTFASVTGGILGVNN